MKYQLKYRSFLLALISLLIFTIGSQNLYAQKAKQNRVRLSVQYVKIIDGEVYFDIKASSKIKKKNVKVSNIELSIFNEFDDEKELIGKTTTNAKGESRFVLKSLSEIRSDSSNLYTITVSYKGNKSFKKAKKSIE